MTKKSKAKSSVSAAQSPRVVRPSAPDGYVSLDRAPNWDHDANPIIKGVRGETEEIVVDKGRPTERLQRSMTVEDETIGAVTVWESGMLRNLFDRTKEGDTVRIEFLGYGEPRNKDEAAPKKFTCAVAEKKGGRNPF